MIIKASTALRNDYAGISNLAKETNEPIYITKNGDGDLVVMNIEAFEKREQMLKLRESFESRAGAYRRTANHECFRSKKTIERTSK